MRLLIIGPPGSGKGTQALRLSAHFGIPPISTGEMFRSHIRRGTPLGMEATSYLAAGDFVPDHITTALVRSRLQEADAANGFLLDGYPRTEHQVSELDAMLQSSGTPLTAAVELTVRDHEIVRRLSLRADTETRSDDTEDVIRHRLNLYREETEPVIERYNSRGILIRINGAQDVPSVTSSALNSLTAKTRSTAHYEATPSQNTGV